MDEEQAKAMAKQLRQPEGEEGIKTGTWMNEGNVNMNLATIEALAAQPHDQILEIGMGNGYFVKDIVGVHESIKYTGCDFSEVMVQESIKNNQSWIDKGQVAFYYNSAEQLPLPDKQFNKIFTLNTIYFWEDHGKILAELRRVLTNDGTLMIVLRPKHQMIKYPMTKYGFNMYTKEEAVDILENHGFKVVEATENMEPDFLLNGMLMKMENIIIKAVPQK